MRTAQREQEVQAPAFNTRTTLAAWRCMECNVAAAGYIEPTDFKPRRCQGVPKSKLHAFGRICGGAMIEIHRSDAR